METLVEAPMILLPSRSWLTTDPAGQPTYRHVWPLIAWRVSGDLRYAKQRRHGFGSQLEDYSLNPNKYETKQF